MSDRTIDIDTTHSTAKTVSHAPTSAEVAEYRARLAKVLDRGLVIDRLHIELPDHLHGEWHPKEQLSRMELLGYEIDTEYAPKRSLHERGDGSANVGDVTFMVIPKWRKEIIDEIARKHYQDTHLRDRRKMKEERDFEAQNREIGMPVRTDKQELISSSLEEVSGEEIKATLTPKG